MTLEIITAPALAQVRHGFFTRRGGASSGVFEGLNCGQGSSDQSEIVAINRARAAEAMGSNTGDLIGLHQVHSARVVTVEAPHDGSPPRADALVTDRPGLLLVVLAADCQPVLLADAGARIVGAAHAGWKGALSGVLEATLDAMEQLGATRSRIQAVIGPTISKSAYEVGPEFMDDFVAADPENARFFANGHGDRLHFDLPGFGVARLRTAGVGHAEWSGHCTYSDADRFFSYRRSIHRQEADYGRLISVIGL